MMGKIGSMKKFYQVNGFNSKTWPIHPIFTDSLEGIVFGIRLGAVRLEAKTTRPSHTRLDRVFEPCSSWKIDVDHAQPITKIIDLIPTQRFCENIS